jgi:hypothetical protein
VLNIFTLLLKTVHKIKQKKSFFQKKLLHSYLLLKGAQYFSLLLKTVNKIKQKNIFFPKKLLHSYLLLKGAQYFYTFAQNSK